MSSIRFTQKVGKGQYVSYSTKPSSALLSLIIVGFFRYCFYYPFYFLIKYCFIVPIKFIINKITGKIKDKDKH